MTGETAPRKAPLVINGWSIYAHPMFLDQLEELIEDVEARKASAPDTWHKKNCAKRLAAIFKVVTEVVPRDPQAREFRLGKSLGDARRHWFRAKFLQQYRLFYRFDGDAGIIVFVWLNDENTLRAYGSKTDAYSAFRKMLKSGNPPDDFKQLRKSAQRSEKRFRRTIRTATGE